MSANDKNRDSSDNPGLNPEAVDSEAQSQPVVALPGDERDVLISRVVDGVASTDDWKIFRAAAAHDPSIWSDLAETQRVHESLESIVHHETSIADLIDLPGGVMDDQPLRTRLDIVSKWGGWAAAAAILIVWFFGRPMNASTVSNDLHPDTAGIPGAGMLLDQAQPNQAFDQYLSAGQQAGQVVGEMPEHIVIETRPMPDGTIEVLYLRQIIERQVINHAYREMRDETGNSVPVPVRISPILKSTF